MATFTVVNDETLCGAIAATKEAVAYVAPGISKPVVDALSESLMSHPGLQITVVIDLDPEVYRLGYGTEEGLRALQELVRLQHLALRQQAGLRIGLLVTDDQTLVYSPTPLLIEAGSTSEAKPNAVVISRLDDPTTALMAACAAPGFSGHEPPPPQDAEIGRAAASPSQVNESLRSLLEVPPKRFDVARIERVYESKIQFVEIELTGYRLSSKRVTIPNDLLLGETKAFKERLKNSFLLLQGDQTISVEIPDLNPLTGQPELSPNGKPRFVPWSEATLEAHRKALYEDFLITVPRFGQVIMRRNRGTFDGRVALLTEQIKAFKIGVRKALQERLTSAIRALAESLLPRVRANLPQRYARVLPVADPSNDTLLGLLEADLGDSFGTGLEIFNPDLRCVFKDVTYESINDKEFRASLSKALADSGGPYLVTMLFPEHDAAPEAAD